MYLKDKIDKCFEIYCKFFAGKNRTLLKSIADNEHKNSYKNLSYNILLSNGAFPELNFLKKYGTLYSLLESLLTKKTTVSSANAD